MTYTFQYISCCSLSDYAEYEHPNTSQFQYISCCSLSSHSFFGFSCNMSFNTSHVVVYRNALFSKNSKAVFQYISCCSLSVCACGYEPGYKQVSIHLMLQFIKHYYAVVSAMCGFQYISCCSLSKMVDWKALQFIGFNTSHVVVYPANKFINCIHCIVSIHLMLQFISHAENTTKQAFTVSIHLMLQFILEQSYICQDLRCFNTSHVVVYRKRITVNTFQYLCFNTSHVVVYLGSVCLYFIKIFVSIHLMLQFI